MNEILRELVDAARILEGRLELSPERVDVAALAAQIADRSRADADDPSVEVAAHSAWVLGDPHRIGSALRAMVRAAGWWGREGPVRIEVIAKAETVRLEVARSGADLGRDSPKALFAAGLAGAGAGARLGLFVARGVAEAHGGSLVAEVGDELRLSFTLPLSL
jgi:signal transduction histidine kinase